MAWKRIKTKKGGSKKSPYEKRLFEKIMAKKKEINEAVVLSVGQIYKGISTDEFKELLNAMPEKKEVNGWMFGIDKKNGFILAYTDGHRDVALAKKITNKDVEEFIKMEVNGE